jgi:hypothetical protein
MNLGHWGLKNSKKLPKLGDQKLILDSPKIYSLRHISDSFKD